MPQLTHVLKSVLAPHDLVETQNATHHTTIVCTTFCTVSLLHEKSKKMIESNHLYFKRCELTRTFDLCRKIIVTQGCNSAKTSQSADPQFQRFERFSTCEIFKYEASSNASGSAINPSHPNISMHILHNVLCTFPKELTRRICRVIKSFIGW